MEWKSMEVWKRLTTAFMASVDNKVNIAEVARLYGQGMTYDALENQLRKVKKDANQMKEEAEGRDLPATPARGRGRKLSVTPKKDAVKTGRVTKNKAPATKVKSEPIVQEDSDAEQDNAIMEDADDYA